jgi:hypothetical protein
MPVARGGRHASHLAQIGHHPGDLNAGDGSMGAIERLLRLASWNTFLAHSAGRWQALHAIWIAPTAPLPLLKAARRALYVPRLRFDFFTRR